MKETIKEFDLNKVVDLKFDPKSKEMKTFLMNITPEKLLHIFSLITIKTTEKL